MQAFVCLWLKLADMVVFMEELNPDNFQIHSCGGFPTKAAGVGNWIWPAREGKLHFKKWFECKVLQGNRADPFEGATQAPISLFKLLPKMMEIS